MTRRVVILSPGGSFLDDLLAALARRGTHVHGVVMYDPRLRRAPADDSLPARLRMTALRPLRRVWRMRNVFARAAAERRIVTGALNGEGTVRALRRLRPDVVMLAKCGLVQPHLIQIPAEGMVNVHPGLLPWIRGRSPLGNSLLRGIPLGATAFRVDAGIDTGRILQRRLVAIGGDSEPELRDALYRLWLEMTVGVIEAATAGPLPAGMPHPGRFPLCRDLKGSPDQQPAVDAAVRDRAARRLLERWRPLCDPADLSLPTDADADFLPRPG